MSAPFTSTVNVAALSPEDFTALAHCVVGAYVWTMGEPCVRNEKFAQHLNYIETASAALGFRLDVDQFREDRA